MEETKVKTRSAAATEVPSGLKELGDQLARLMAALTRAEQSTRSARVTQQPKAQGSWERTDRQAHSCAAQTPTMVGLAWAKPLLTAPPLSNPVPNPHARGIKICRTSIQSGMQGAQGSSSFQCYRCQGWGHMARECTTPMQCS